MNRYHVLKDGMIVGTTATKELAIDMIQQHQARETHYSLRANFSYIFGEEEFVAYPKTKNTTKG